MTKGAKVLSVRTVDTDVVVLLVGHFSSFGPCDIWVEFGMGKNFRRLHINDIVQNLGDRPSRALLVFHAYTGCDTTSSFTGIGKKTAWKAWKSLPEVTNAFLFIRENPFKPIEVSNPHFSTLERFTVVMYDKTSSHDSVNNARRELFTKSNRSLDHIPPSQVIILGNCSDLIQIVYVKEFCLYSF